MKTIIRSFLFSLLLLTCFGQTDFDINAYKDFLASHKNLTYDELMQMHDAGKFKSAISSFGNPIYYDSVKIKYGLTDYEESLLEKHGFVVTERLNNKTFGSLFEDIYHKDLPVFVSTDAILYAFHASYDRILKDIEVQVLIPNLEELLNNMVTNLNRLETEYENPQMLSYLKDVDLYLSVARNLLNGFSAPYYSENLSKVFKFISYINDEEAVSIPFFSETPRRIDFSQFKPRGHYDDEHYPELARYFKSMIWLGRMELYLIAPQSLDSVATNDLKRQTIISFLIEELLEFSGSEENFYLIEDFLLFQIGEQDNVTIGNLRKIAGELSIENASAILDEEVFEQFQNLLSTKSYAFQRILSQILVSDPSDPDGIVPASAFLLFGQRFIIDSFVTGNVVFDKTAARRMLPKTLDILFSLGNDAALQLLQEELNKYGYSSNLAALRYLIDAYEEEFWEETIYNGWLNSIRELNPPKDRSQLPEFMQTAAWWQEKLNTQLAAWSQLRHDFILYAKQSYTGVPVCSYPYSYVEPIPEFFLAMKILAEKCFNYFAEVPFVGSYAKDEITNYYQSSINTYDTLAVIAQKELTGEALTQNEIEFLSGMLSITYGCTTDYSGWYPELFYQPYVTSEGLFKKDFIVVDYHTSPADENGNIVGWVNHAGTGPVDMAIISAENHDGEPTVFVGPVLSYYELTTDKFTRLTDDEWASEYLQTANRPDWVNLYLANTEGESRGDGTTLLTSVSGDNSQENLPNVPLLAQNYPNPFNGQTLINFSIPSKLSNSRTILKIFDITGREIKILIDEILPSGNYITRWDATNQSKLKVSSGIYFYRLSVGESFITGKMNFIK